MRSVLKSELLNSSVSTPAYSHSTSPFSSLRVSTERAHAQRERAGERGVADRARVDDPRILRLEELILDVIATGDQRDRGEARREQSGAALRVHHETMAPGWVST